MNFLIGAAAGFFGGLVGLGGGVIMIPLMVGVLKMKQKMAHGTSLVALVFTGLSGAVTYSLNGSVDVLAAVLLASTAIFTSRAGVRFANTLPEWKLKRYFGIFLIFVSCLLLIKPFLSQIDEPITGWLKVVVFLLTGAFTGFLSGMMGVGGGTIMVPAMVLLAGFSQYTAQGSSLLAMVPIGAVGAYTHWRLGNVNTGILPGLILGILLGSYLGGSFANLLPETLLRIIFAIILIRTGLKNLKVAKPDKQKQLQ